MTPLNWFTGITETILLPTAAYNISNWLGWFSFALAAAIIIFYGVVYIFWCIKEPNRLQTEGYNIVAQGLHIESASLSSKDVRLGNSNRPALPASTAAGVSIEED